MTAPLPPSFFQRDALTVARALLGKILVSRMSGVEVRVRLTETEAYHQSERGSHTYGGRRTVRTEPMFAAGGISYVYFVYGMHWQFNVVTGEPDVGEAVLLRAGVPLTDADARAVAQRRFGEKSPPREVAKWCNGPAKLTQALALDKSVNALALTPEHGVWLEDAPDVDESQVARLPRVGIAYAKEDAALPWRFLMSRD